MKTLFRIVGGVLGLIILVVVGYAAYLFGSYHRLGSAPIKVEGRAKGEDKTTIDIVSWNIGFGAYEEDYDFFMDGGSQSWAPSKDQLEINLINIAAVLADRKADIYLLQEVDIDGTRTYHVNEVERLAATLGEGRQYTFAQNFDSPFLMYPFTQPHGANKSGLLTFSSYPINEAERVELPVEDSLKKILDLDRCYSKQYLSLQEGKTLVIYNLHLSAYTSDGKIAVEQLKILLSDMQQEYGKGNYCIAGGDFNKDLQGDSSKYFGKADKDYTWAQPLPEGIFDGYNISLVAPLNSDKNNEPAPTGRNADSAYHPGQFVLSLDGFLVSDNVNVKSNNVIDTGFKYSDHNPVRMTVELK